MTKPTTFDSLLRALHNTVIEAQKLTEQQHLRQLHRYFYQPGKENESNGAGTPDNDVNNAGMPKRFKIKVPNMDPDAQEAWRDLEVPQLALVPPGSLQIKDLKVAFNVILRGLVQDDPITEGFAIEGEDPHHRGPIMIETGTIVDSNDPNMARVRMSFVGADAPESLHRINDMLAKVISQ